MTLVIYDALELEERASQQLRAWKVWQTTLYVVAAMFGIINYTFLVETELLVDSHCIFYPRELAFHWVELPNVTTQTDVSLNFTDNDPLDAPKSIHATKSDKAESNDETNVAQVPAVPTTEDAKLVKRDAPNDYVRVEMKTVVEESNGTVITANKTHRYMLNAQRTLFPSDDDAKCQMGEYMPLLSSTFAILWATLFIMCPNGGKARTGLRQPWRILTPALVFAFFMVILTGISFSATNGGLHAFCAAFHNYTNTTACSAVNPYLERSWNASWGVGGRMAATRAAAAGVWAAWACACALLLARCLSAADFELSRISVQLVKDPHQKVTPYLERQKAAASRQRSPRRHDTMSIQSDPTATTELVTASVEHEPDSQPTSLAATPSKDRRGLDDLDLEMVHLDNEKSRVHL